MFDELKILHKSYKKEIGETEPTESQLQTLKQSVECGDIRFFGCVCNSTLMACCSVCVTFSTFDYKRCGVFEDFFILPTYRHQGIAKKLVAFAYQQCKVGSLVVGCADCDVEMYKAIGFETPLGNMLAYNEKRTAGF